METKVTEFEMYLAILSGGLHAKEAEREDICREIGQNLYDKYNELLIKGVGMDEGVARTLESFEAPDVLAGMFNRMNGTAVDLSRAVHFILNRRLLLAVLVATILTALLV